MRFKSFILVMVCSVWGLLIACSLSAADGDDLVFYKGGSFGNGSQQFSNGIIEPDASFQYQGLATLKVTPTDDYQSGGLHFYGELKPFVGAANILEFTVFLDTNTSGYMNGFTLNLSTGSFDPNTDIWTIDGEPGAIAKLTGGEWHTIAVDLTSISGFTAGTNAGVSSQFTGLVTLKTNTATNVELNEYDSYYIGDVRIRKIPEPSAYAMAIGGIVMALSCVTRRRW